MNYAEARDILSGKKGYGYARALKTPKPGRTAVKVANNTYLERRDSRTVALRFHATDVLTFTPSYVELRSGGWHTASTRDRLDYGPVRISANRSGWTVVTSGEIECYCVRDSRETSGLAVRLPDGSTALDGFDIPAGQRLRFTDSWTGEPYDTDNGSRPIYGLETCPYCDGSQVTRGFDWASGGHPYFEGMRVKPDGSGLLTSQPNRPDNWSPVRTVSGFSGLSRRESRAARNRQYEALRAGDWETATRERDRLAGLGERMAGETVTTAPVALLQPDRIEETPLGTARVFTMSQDMIRGCPFVIFSPDHYRADGSCRCNDATHTEMIEWGYRWNGSNWEGSDDNDN